MRVKTELYKSIRRAIVLENLNPGERLVESQLCRQYGVSRGPVREVLAQLSREGFVELIPNKGAAVAKISVEDLGEYYTLIALLESQAVKWAVPRLGTTHLAALAEINQELAKIIAGGKEEGVQAWGRYNLRFHRVFWENSGNRKLEEQIHELRQRIQRYRYTSLMVPSYREYWRDHETIISATHRQAPDEAGQAMQRHIMRALDVLMQYFTHIPGH